MYEDRIVIDSEIRHGKPVIRGTRVPVDVILGSLAGGMSVEEVAKEIWNFERGCSGSDRICCEDCS